MTKKTVLLGLILLLCGGLFLFNASVQADENDEAEMKMCVGTLFLYYSPANASVSNFPGGCSGGFCMALTSYVGNFSGWVTRSGCDSDMWRMSLSGCGDTDSDTVNLRNCSSGGCG